MTPIVKRGAFWGEDGWCAIRRKDDGQYAVAPCFQQNGRSPWPEDGSDLYTAHILVRAVTSYTQEQLREGLEAVIGEMMGESATHRGWVPPTLNTVAKRVSAQPFVAYVSINQKGLR